MNPDPMLFIEGADSAILGYVHRCGQDPMVVYSYEKLLEHFMKEGMDEVDAVEWIEFNIVGAWAGTGTPAVLVEATKEEIEDQYGGDFEPQRGEDEDDGS